jgi:hypothetical protein
MGYEDYDGCNFKDVSATKYTLTNKGDYNLYRPEEHQNETSVRLKRIIAKDGLERWKFYIDLQIMLTLDATDFTKSQRVFMRTQEGFSYLIERFKAGEREAKKFKIGMPAPHLTAKE